MLLCPIQIHVSYCTTCFLLSQRPSSLIGPTPLLCYCRASLPILPAIHPFLNWTSIQPPTDQKIPKARIRPALRRAMREAAQIPVVVEEAKKALAEGYAVVIGLQSTGEASADALGLQPGDVCGFVSVARELLSRFIATHFPVRIEDKQLQQGLWLKPFPLCSFTRNNLYPPGCFALKTRAAFLLGGLFGFKLIFPLRCNYLFLSNLATCSPPPYPYPAPQQRSCLIPHFHPLPPFIIHVNMPIALIY